MDINQSVLTTVETAGPSLTSVGEALEHALRQPEGGVDGVISMLLRTALAIQERMNAQLNAIIEADAFQKMEARWRSLQNTVWSKGTNKTVKIKVYDLSWEELARDLHYNSDIHRTSLVRKLGKQEYETLGGEPFGIMIVDHALSVDVETEYDQLYTAQLLGDLGAACVCPIVLDVSDDFLGESDAAWYSDTTRVKNVLGSSDYEAWARLRKAPNSRFLGLAMPRHHLRGRYEDLDIGFRFHQWPSQSNGLWGGAAPCFAQTVIAEFISRAWFGFLKLVSTHSGSGAVLAYSGTPVPEGTAPVQRARIRLTHHMARFYSEEGFIPLAESTKSNQLYFVGNRSVLDCESNPMKEVLTQLQSVLIACRLVHYVKVKIRYLIGQVITVRECEEQLNSWLEQYVSTSAMANSEHQSKFPFRGARVKLAADPADAARYFFEILVQPQYQIDHVLGEIALATDFLAPEGKLK
ncbi:type VI secretion system contractile sheath domain-containing protein [Flexibacterium corallicola]|uniref:type VI secretion system contractile sheath domain-containing protein n=1 Tax=Flexibacterium corallicola TaxID=3037259 RepID=UPI00286FA64A|nr:type VI secretion system contractile sheath large subunit [Pseudovibrio sp. M1P-2-3]